MSKIIKSFEDSPIAYYDFRVLHGGLQEESDDRSPDRIVFNPWNAGRIAEPDGSDVLDDIEATIQSRLLEIERRGQEIEEEAYTRGYAQGERDGYAVGEKSMQIVKDRMEKLLANLESIPEKVLKDYRGWLVSASMAIARKIVGMELEINPLALTALAERLLDEARPHHTLTLYIHPKDFEVLSKAMDLEKWKEEAGRPFLLKTDPRMERGGCRLESDIQAIDAGLETRFSALEQVLYDEQPIRAE